MSGDITPWWAALEIRPEIIDASGQIDDVQMSLADAVYATGVTRPLYADVEYYGQITHPTGQLAALLAGLAIRLGGGAHDYAKTPALTRLNQGMGGGKSHAAIGAYHLASDPVAFSRTDIGQRVWAEAKQILGSDLPSDLRHPHAVVLPADQMAPGAPKKEIDGPFARNLYERFLWRLFSGDANLFQKYQPYPTDKGRIKEALIEVGRPILILIDEIMDYVGNGLDATNDQSLTAADMGFLEALADAVNDVPNVAALVIMIDPDKDSTTNSLSADARGRQAHLLRELDRNGGNTTVNEDTDFTAILRRRLFSAPPEPGLVKQAAQVYQSILNQRGWAKVFESIAAPWVKQWDSSVERSYPFHPQLMQLTEQEWAKNSGYQNVRATIRVFAATVFALSARAKEGGWAPLLIGPGDLPMWDPTVRSSIIGSGLLSDTNQEQNYRSIFQGDITTLSGAEVRGGQARLLDDDSVEAEAWGVLNPHAHERAATMIAVSSLMPRGQGRRGASAAEIKVASSIPNTIYSVGDADGVLERLTDLNSEKSMAAVNIDRIKGQQSRYYIDPVTGPKVIYRQQRQAVKAEDRDDVLANMAQDIATTGPFKKKPFITADHSLPSDEARRDRATDYILAAGIDDARVNRMVVLDPAGFSLRNGMSDATIRAVSAAMGLGEQAAPVEWASSAVFVVVNTQRRRYAREAATDYLAWKRTYESPEIATNEQGRSMALDGMREAESQLKKQLRRAYQHILYLSQPTPDAPRCLEEITLEEDALTALDGTVVWKELAARQKAFLPGQFGSQALIFNLREADFERPLAEVRDAFYQAPRLPLLPNGDQDLRNAIYAAIQSGDLQLVRADGTEVVVDSPDSINLTSQSYRIAKAAPEVSCDVCGQADCGGVHDAAACPKCGQLGCEGSCSSPCPKCGMVGCEGSCDATPVAQQTKSVKFTLAHEVGPESSAQLVELIGALYAALLSGETTFITGTTEVVTSELNAGKLQTAAENLGIKPAVKDL